MKLIKKNSHLKPVFCLNKITTKIIFRSVSWNRDSPAEKLSFTMRREFDRQKEETELIEQLRKSIDSRLKMTLPKDIGSALTDGVVLCHLANHVRPRSVGSIHVPSPAVVRNAYSHLIGIFTYYTLNSINSFAKFFQIHRF